MSDTGNTMQSYHNTNNETGSTLATSEAKAKSQEANILNFYKQNPNKMLTAEDIYNELYINTKVPITSVRRAITNLTNDNILTKLNHYRKSSYGKMSHCYAYMTNLTLF